MFPDNILIHLKVHLATIGFTVIAPMVSNCAVAANKPIIFFVYSQLCALQFSVDPSLNILKKRK